MIPIVFLTGLANPLPWLAHLRHHISKTVPNALIHLDTPHSHIQDPHPPFSNSPHGSLDSTSSGILAWDPTKVEIAIVDSPAPSSFLKYPNLRLVASLWAGIDGLLKRSDFPPPNPSNTTPPVLIRLVDPELTASMSESVLLHTLSAHRRLHPYIRQQADQVWSKRPKEPYGHFQDPEFILTSERRVGVLGLGELGMDAIKVLVRNGFRNVKGWGRTCRPPLHVKYWDEEKDVMSYVDVNLFHGQEGLETLLKDTEILINLLPLTESTRGILSKKTLSELPKGATIINLGRGEHLVESDLQALLDEKHIDTAILDVFSTEPLPKGHWMWSHPRVVVVPHMAGVTVPQTAAVVVAETVGKWVGGQREGFEGYVDYQKGY
ncbi:hypothetical protein HDV05_004250 [Chytridiales sp. JEL 0842]|nr:hypothetical protein HDV05_004250 [Chytridiales sp. JEL 0842]